MDFALRSMLFVWVEPNSTRDPMPLLTGLRAAQQWSTFLKPHGTRVGPMAVPDFGPAAEAIASCTRHLGGRPGIQAVIVACRMWLFRRPSMMDTAFALPRVAPILPANLRWSAELRPL